MTSFKFQTTAAADYGRRLLVVSSGAGLCLSVFDYFFAAGINRTGGVALVIVSTALMLASSSALALDRSEGQWLRAFLIVALLLDVIGTAFAAYFLEAHLLLAAMVLALIGWIVSVGAGPRDRREIPVKHAHSGAAS